MRSRWLTVSTILAAAALASTAACVGDLPEPPGTGIWGKSSSGVQQGAPSTPVTQVPTAQPGIYANSPPAQPSIYSNSVPPARSGMYSHSPPLGMTSSSTPSPAAQGQSSSPPNQGPITGYGPGGMRAAPGTPAVPPY